MGTRITIQNKGTESAPIVIDLNKSSEGGQLSGSEIANTFLANAAVSGGVNAGRYAAQGAMKMAGGSIAAALVGMGLGTILTTCVSCGTFEKGEDIIKSNKCTNKINAFKHSNKNTEVTPTDVKNDPRARTKSGFWNWFFTGNNSGKKVNSIPKHDVIIKQVNGVTIAVTTLTPFFGSTDLRQLGGQKILIVTGFYRGNGGEIKSKNLCRGYLAKGGKVNASGESLLPKLSLESILEPEIEKLQEQMAQEYFNDNKWVN